MARKPKDKPKVPVAIHVDYGYGSKTLNTFQTREKMYTQRKENFRIRARYGMHYIKGNRLPYFSLTAEIDVLVNGRWRDHAGGQMPDEIEKHFPDLYHRLARWHLTDQDGCPMHYIANGKFWADLIGGRRPWGEGDTDPLGALQRTIVYGVLSEDWQTRSLIHLCKDAEDFERWLQNRIPGLREKFLQDMKGCNVTLIPDEVLRKHYPEVFAKAVPEIQGQP